MTPFIEESSKEFDAMFPFAQLVESWGYETCKCAKEPCECAELLKDFLTRKLTEQRELFMSCVPEEGVSVWSIAPVHEADSLDDAAEIGWNKARTTLLEKLKEKGLLSFGPVDN